MEDAERNILRNMKREIKRNFIPENEVIDILESKDTISEETARKIKQAPSDYEKIEMLLEVLPKRGPSAFQSFIDTLNESSNKHVADMLCEALEQELGTAEGVDAVHSDTDDTGIQTKRNAPQRIDAEIQTIIDHPQRADAEIKTITEQPQTIDAQTQTTFDISQRISEVRKQYDTRIIQIHDKLVTHMRSNSTDEKTKPTLQVIENLVDELIDVERSCYDLLGVRVGNFTLPFHISALQEKLARCREEADKSSQMERSRNHFETLVQTLTTEKEALQSSVTTLRGSLKIVQNEMEQIHSRLTNKTNEFVELKKELEHYKSLLVQRKHTKLGPHSHTNDFNTQMTNADLKFDLNNFISKQSSLSFINTTEAAQSKQSNLQSCIQIRPTGTSNQDAVPIEYQTHTPARPARPQKPPLQTHSSVKRMQKNFNYLQAKNRSEQERVKVVRSMFSRRKRYNQGKIVFSNESSPENTPRMSDVTNRRPRNLQYTSIVHQFRTVSNTTAPTDIKYNY